MRGRSGFVPGLVPAGFVGVLVAGVAVPAGLAGVLVAGVVAPLPFVGVAPPVLPMGDGAGVAGVGSDTSGVGSGGNGLAATPAMNSVIPASESLCRYLYQVVRTSSHTVSL